MVLIIAVLLAELAKVRPQTESKMIKKKWNIIKHKNLSSLIKMGKVVLMFNDIEIKKSYF